MGGGRYDEDVAHRTRSTNVDTFAVNQYLAQGQDGTARREVHPELNISGKVRECLNETPIVIAMDVTRSRGDDTKLMYDKLPMFIGQIELKNYVPSPGVSFAAVGDATSGDKAPLQVSQFEADNRLDDALGKVWIEEGGGGTGQESYELAAYYYARHSKVAAVEQGRKGYFFFLGDEGFYPEVSAHQIQQVLGQTVPANVPSAQIFAELQRKFHTFLIFPRKTMAERKSDIDAEIRQRVLSAGGRVDGVDIRASLLWNNRNDLDLHVITPAGEHIFFGKKQGTCGGWLDVDMNVRGETDKPVENIQWRRGTAPPGRYQFYVQNYRFHEAKQSPTAYRAEIEINGKVQHFEGVISGKGETSEASNTPIFEFTYDPEQRQKKVGEVSAYDNYADEVILKQWGSVLPEAHILKIEDPKAIVDVMLGVLAIVGGSADLEKFLADMRGREQLALRQDEALRTLSGLAHEVQLARAQVTGALPADDDGAPRRGSRSRRL